MLDTYLCILSLLAVNVLPEEKYTELLASSDATKAEAVLQTLTTLGMPEYLTEGELLSTEESISHAYTLSALFSWFCDPTLTGGLPPHTASKYSINEDGQDNMLNTSDIFVATHEKYIDQLTIHPIQFWIDRWNAINENKRFRILGEAVNWDVERASVVQLRPAGQTEEDALNEKVRDLLKQANTLFDAKEYENAAQVVDEVFKHAPDSIEAHLIKGKIYHYGLNQPDLAKQEYDTCIHLDPRYSPAYRHKADLLHYVLNQYKPAIKEYNRAIKYADNASADAYNNRGEAYLQLGNSNDDAWEDFEGALKIDPDHQRAKENRERLLAEQQREQKLKAEEAIKAAMSTLPTIQFDRNRYNIDDEDVESLNAVVQIMKMYGLIKLRVTGITINKNKIALAKKRSQACVEYIAQRGVDKARMDAIGVHGDQMATIFTPI